MPPGRKGTERPVVHGINERGSRGSGLYAGFVQAASAMTGGILRYRTKPSRSGKSFQFVLSMSDSDVQPIEIVAIITLKVKKKLGIKGRRSLLKPVTHAARGKTKKIVEGGAWKGPEE